VVTRRGVFILAAAALLAAGPASADTARPRCACDPRGRCTVSELPPMVSDREVRRYLESGLTTSLVLTLSGKDRASARHKSAARIDVRFEPWEEMFFVWIADAGGRPRSESVAPAALARWWQDLQLSFVLGGPPQGAARVEVDLIPFSEEEEADTRRWYAEALRPAVPSSASGDATALTPVFDALTLTSIKRHGVLRFSWSSSVTETP
jgi:hypothetical protein